MKRLTKDILIGAGLFFLIGIVLLVVSITVWETTLRSQLKYLDKQRGIFIENCKNEGGAIIDNSDGSLACFPPKIK